MNHELMRRLKHAKFPFKRHELPADELVGFPVDGELLRIPTLEELINACGEDFFALKVHYEPEIEWICYSNQDRCVITTEGKTQSIAVANLWLSLQADKEDK